MGYSAATEKPWWVLPPGGQWDDRWTRDEQIIVPAWREAHREAASWFQGWLYQWTPLDAALRTKNR